jgi:AraC-like DNA-binding protein/mannose-6-phosphate isomerase-like protein (cupin superfamily)
LTTPEKGDNHIPVANCFNDIEILWISRFDYRKNWILAPHVHEDLFQLIYCINGSCTLVLNGQAFHIQPQMTLFFPPGLEHGFINIKGGGLKTLDTKFRIHSRRLAAFCKRLPFIITNSGEIYEELENIRGNGITKDILYEENCRLLLAQILIKLIRMTRSEKMAGSPEDDFTPNRRLSSLSGKVMEYIKAHYQEPVNSAELEQKLHYSYRYLSKFFHREMNMTPVQFGERYRVFKAKDLLKNSEMEIKNISETLNYSDIHQFTRSFKKVTGIPPAQWRKTAWSGICQDVVIHSGFENTLHIEPVPDLIKISPFLLNTE